jgi:hypothetical protein
MELKFNGKLFPDHLSFILHGALVGAGSQVTLKIAIDNQPISL